MYIFIKSTHCRLRDLWRWQQCCLRYKSYGILHSGNWYLGTGASNDHSAISFRVKESKKIALPSDGLGLNMEYNARLCLSLFTSWHSVTFQNNLISSCTSILSRIGLYLRMWYNMAAAVSTLVWRCGRSSLHFCGHNFGVGVSAFQAVSQII